MSFIILVLVNGMRWFCSVEFMVVYMQSRLAFDIPPYTLLLSYYLYVEVAE